MGRGAQLLTSIFVVLLLSGCGVQGSGEIVSESRDVRGFSSVSLSGSGHLDIKQDGTESLTITADDNLLPYLTSEVRGGTLHLGVRDHTGIEPSRMIVYSLTVRGLEDISVSGNATIDASGVQTERLGISVSGAGEIMIDGAVDTQEISISGVGKYEAEDLRSKVASLTVSGAASAVVAASEKLDVSISGAGEIEYIGEPAITRQISGAGSIRRRQ